MPINSRAKGQAFERLIAKYFRQIYPNAERGFQTRSGKDAPDVQNCGPWWVECKHGKRTNPKAALKQAHRDAPPGALPVAVCRDNGQAITVTLYLGHFFLLAHAYELFTRSNGGDYAENYKHFPHNFFPNSEDDPAAGPDSPANGVEK